MAASVCAWIVPAGTALAAASGYTSVSAAFNPERLGSPTTINFAVSIDPGATGPIPLDAVEVSYPNNLGLATSGLGVESCDPVALEINGARACPPDSKMGEGRALVEVPFGPELVKEEVTLGIFAAPSNDGYIHLAILAAGKEPVIAAIVLTGELLPGRLTFSVPPIASLPGAPYAALVNVQATLGGALTYYEHVRGRTIAYRPRGIGLPNRCPRGGFKVAASLHFTDGESSRGGTVIGCPRSRRRGH